ncbi:MAG: hypothetical protein GY830_02110 [Bacteroidetes bacterium]|nr:hypothetical protein [Bacteroidota bacterium]
MEVVAQLFDISLNFFKHFNTSFLGEEIKDKDAEFKALLTPLDVDLRQVKEYPKSLLKRQEVFVLRKAKKFKKENFPNEDIFNILKLKNFIGENNNLSDNFNTINLSEFLNGLMDHDKITFKNIRDVKDLLLESVSLSEYIKRYLSKKYSIDLENTSNIYDHIRLFKIKGSKHKGNATLIEDEAGLGLCLGENIIKSLGISEEEASFNIERLDFVVYHEILERYYEDEFDMKIGEAHEIVINEDLHRMTFYNIFPNMKDIEMSEAFVKMHTHYQDDSYNESKNSNNESDNITDDENNKEHDHLLKINSSLRLHAALSELIVPISTIINIQGMVYDNNQYSISDLIINKIDFKYLVDLYELKVIINKDIFLVKDLGKDVGADILLTGLIDYMVEGLAAEDINYLILATFVLHKAIAQVYQMIDIANASIYCFAELSIVENIAS